MSKINLRRLAKRIHQGLSKDMTLMKVQHLIAQAHGHDSWDSVLTLEKDERAKIYVEFSADGKANECTLDINGFEAKVSRISYNSSTNLCDISIGPPSVPFKIRRSINDKHPEVDVYRDPPKFFTEEFDSIEELAHRAKTLKDEGYNIIPSDTPTEGVVGVMAIKSSSPNDEHRPPEYQLNCYLYGRLELISERVPVRQLIQLFNKDGFFNCDNPRERTLGVIKYENGKAYHYFFPLSGIRNANLDEEESKRITSRAVRGATPMKTERLRLLEIIGLNPLQEMY